MRVANRLSLLRAEHDKLVDEAVSKYMLLITDESLVDSVATAKFKIHTHATIVTVNGKYEVSCDSIINGLINRINIMLSESIYRAEQRGLSVIIKC